MEQHFAGRVIAITGAASGIGRALALELARQGADLALSDVQADALEATVAAAERFGVRALGTVVDVADRQAVYAWKDATLETFGRADGIINNAGVSLSATVEEMSYEDLDWIVGINFWGVIYGTKAFLGDMLSRREGWIVNISSVFGLIGVPTQSAYNATKFAVRGFTESLRQELNSTDITVTSVHPGGIKTNIVRAGRHRTILTGSPEKAARQFDKMARTSPEEAARVIVEAMIARRGRVLIGPDARVIDAVQRLLPEGYDTLVRRSSQRIKLY